MKAPREPRPKNARQVQSNVKVLLIIFVDNHVKVHQELLRQDRTVNKEYYLKVIRRLQEAIRKIRSEFWKNNSWLLHYDNSPAHSSLLVRGFLAEYKTTIIPQPSYSSNLHR